MKTKLVGLVGAVALALGAVAAVGPAEAVVPQSVLAPQVATYTPDARFTGGRYLFKDICILDTIHNSTTQWDAGWSANTWEPAVNTGWRSYTQGCGGYPAWQVLRVALYSEASTQCWKWTGYSIPASAPANPWYNRVWTGTPSVPTIWLNTSAQSAGCRDTAVHRAHYLSSAMGEMLGVAYEYCTPSYRVMDTCDEYITAGAWPEDRNIASVLYNPA